MYLLVLLLFSVWYWWVVWPCVAQESKKRATCLLLLLFLFGRLFLHFRRMATAFYCLCYVSSLDGSHGRRKEAEADKPTVCLQSGEWAMPVMSSVWYYVCVCGLPTVFSTCLQNFKTTPKRNLSDDDREGCVLKSKFLQGRRKACLSLKKIWIIDIDQKQVSDRQPAHAHPHSSSPMTVGSRISHSRRPLRVSDAMQTASEWRVRKVARGRVCAVMCGEWHVCMCGHVMSIMCGDMALCAFLMEKEIGM